jgi:hypothetical protein
VKITIHFVIRGKAKTEALTSVRARWLRWLDDVSRSNPFERASPKNFWAGTIIQRQNEYIYIPDLTPQV